MVLLVFSLLVMGIKKWENAGINEPLVLNYDPRDDGPRRGSSDQHQVEMAEPRPARGAAGQGAVARDDGTAA